MVGGTAAKIFDSQIRLRPFRNNKKLSELFNYIELTEGALIGVMIAA